MDIRRRIVRMVAAVGMTAGLVGAAHAEPLRISYFIWVGNGPFFVAQEKGLFAKEGVEVELINIEDHTAAFSGLFAGQVDAIASGTQDVLTFADPNEDPLVCALPLDKSRGGDGILATNDIRRGGLDPAAYRQRPSDLASAQPRRRSVPDRRSGDASRALPVVPSRRRDQVRDPSSDGRGTSAPVLRARHLHRDPAGALRGR